MYVFTVIPAFAALGLVSPLKKTSAMPAIDKSPLPSKTPEPATAPVRESVRGVFGFDAEEMCFRLTILSLCYQVSVRIIRSAFRSSAGTFFAVKDR